MISDMRRRFPAGQPDRVADTGFVDRLMPVYHFQQLVDDLSGNFHAALAPADGELSIAGADFCARLGLQHAHILIVTTK